MTKITWEKPLYNENILTEDFTFDNTKTWDVTVGSGSGATVTTSTSEHFVGEKSLKINHPHYNLNDISFRPTNSTDYSFVVPRNGKYIFSFRTMIHGTNWLPELVGGISFYVNGSGSPYATLPFNIGSNSIPNFTYVYNAWQTFYNEISFTAGQTITLSIHLTYDPLWTPAVLEFFMDGFKMEYIVDKAYNTPTMYSKPIY
jgi:hypothetical protein